MNTTQYKPLPKQWEKSGFRFTEIRREGMIAIYHKVAVEGTYHPKTVDSGFEVGIIKNSEAYEMAGNPIPAKENWPSSEQWGTMGWTYSNLYAAECKYNSLLNKSTEVNDSSVNEVEPEPLKTEVEVDGVKYFTVGQYATNHNIPYVNANLIVKELIAKGSIKFIGEKRLNVKGKPSKIYTAA